MNQEQKEKQVIEPVFYIKGIKKRCRKSQTHKFSLGHREPGEFSKEKLKEIGQKLIEKKMRVTESARVKLVEWSQTGNQTLIGQYKGEEFDIEVSA